MSNKNLFQDTLDFPLTNGSILIGNSFGRSIETPTITTSLTVGDFTGSYAGLAVESNWSNNFTNSVVGSSGDFHFGVGEQGTAYYCYYGQSSWNRVYTNPFVDAGTSLGLSITNALTTSSNWITGGWYYNHTSGDLMQQYRFGKWLYTCINGVTHTWIRSEHPDGYVTSTDISYLPSPQIEIGKANTNSFVVPAGCEIISIVVENETTTAGNISVGSSVGLSDIVSNVSLPIVVGTKKQLLYIVDANYPTTSNRTMYINIDSLATVKLRIVNQKLF